MDGGARVLARLAGFTATLRDNGFTVGLAEAGDAARIMASPLAVRPIWLGQAFRALFCSDADEWRRFDEVFAAYWLERGIRRVTKLSGTAPREGPRTLRQIAEAGAPLGEPQAADAPRDRGDDSSDNPADRRGRREGASRAEALARTDFRHIADPDALAAAHEAAARLAEVLRTRLTRRVRVATAGRRLDMRRTIRASIARGGTPLDLIWRRRRTRPLKLVVLLDASGSMSLYTAVFTRFIHGVIHCFRESEAFLFHTRLVQISDAMRERHPQRAIDRLSLLAEGVGGGTRIGACLGAVQSLARKPRADFAHRTDDRLGRIRHRRARRTWGRDVSAAAAVPANRMAQSDARLARLRAGRTRHGRGAAAHRSLCAGAQP